MNRIRLIYTYNAHALLARIPAAVYHELISMFHRLLSVHARFWFRDRECWSCCLALEREMKEGAQRN